MKYHRLLLVLVLVTSIAAPATAAVGGEAGSSASAAPHQSVGDGLPLQVDNSTGNGTSDNSTGGGSGGSGGTGNTGGSGGSGGSSVFGVDLEAVAQSAIEGAIKSFLNGLGDDAARLAADFNEKGMIFSVPAPGDAGSPPSWLAYTQWPSMNTHGDWWQDTHTYYWAIGFLGFAGLMPALMLAMGKGNRSPNRGTAKRFAQGFVLILLGWIVIAFLYHSADVITQLIAPDEGEYMPILQAAQSNSGSSSELGSVVSGVNGGLLVSSFAILYMQYVLAFVCAALWPAMWVLNAYRSTMARSAGKIAVAFMGALLLLKMLQALFFRFVVIIQPASASGSQVPEIMAAAGVAVTFVVLPYTVLTKMMPRTLLIFGLHELRKKGHENRRYQERMGNIRRKFNQSLRRSPSGGVEQVGPANRGSNGLPDRQPRQLDSGPSDGSRGLPRGSNGRPDRRTDGGDAEDRR